MGGGPAGRERGHYSLVDVEGEDPRPLALEEEIARAVPALDSLGESVAGQPRNAAVVKGHRHDFVGPAAEKGGG